VSLIAFDSRPKAITLCNIGGPSSSGDTVS
jgi:hypothetical protein